MNDEGLPEVGGSKGVRRLAAAAIVYCCFILVMSFMNESLNFIRGGRREIGKEEGEQ